MTLFAQVLNEVVETKTPISSTLLKTRVLASELADSSFQEWVLSELNGYKCHVKDLPDYRRLRVASKGNFYGTWKVTDLSLPLGHLEPEIREVLEVFAFRESVGNMEAMLDARGTEVLSELVA